MPVTVISFTTNASHHNYHWFAGKSLAVTESLALQLTVFIVTTVHLAINQSVHQNSVLSDSQGGALTKVQGTGHRAYKFI